LGSREVGSRAPALFVCGKALRRLHLVHSRSRIASIAREFALTGKESENSVRRRPPGIAQITKKARK